MIKATQQSYKDSTIKIKIREHISKESIVPKGLKQECCLHPHYLKYICWIHPKTWKRKCSGVGLRINGKIYTLQFMDDQVLNAQDKTWPRVFELKN